MQQDKLKVTNKQTNKNRKKINWQSKYKSIQQDFFKKKKKVKQICVQGKDPNKGLKLHILHVFAQLETQFAQDT